jgi:hypothetical protein
MIGGRRRNMPSREKVKNPGPDEWRIVRYYVQLYRTAGINNCKLGSTIIIGGKEYEARLNISERTVKNG